MYVNQSHYILSLDMTVENTHIHDACARWAPFQVKFRLQQELRQNWGMGKQSIVGPLSRDYSICKMGVDENGS